MPTLYSSPHGWTRSKAAAIAACRKSSREDGGGAVEDVWAYTVPAISLEEMVRVLNDAQAWPSTHVASVQHGRLIKPAA